MRCRSVYLWTFTSSIYDREYLRTTRLAGNRTLIKYLAHRADSHKNGLLEYVSRHCLERAEKGRSAGVIKRLVEATVDLTSGWA